MQTIVLQQHRCRGRCLTLIADKLRRIGESSRTTVLHDRLQSRTIYRVLGNICMRARCEWHYLIKKTTGERNHLCAAHRVVSTITGRTIGLRKGVRTVERVVQ